MMSLNGPFIDFGGSFRTWTFPALAVGAQLGKQLYPVPLPATGKRVESK
jgi:hypothetical protein